MSLPRLTPLQTVQPPDLNRIVEFVASSVESGVDLIDVKFYAFTRKRGSTLSHPKPLYGCTKLLTGYSAYLDSLLIGNDFKEGRLLDSDPGFDETLDGYDHESDSDFEEEDSDFEKEDSDFEDYDKIGGAPHSKLAATTSRGRVGRIILLKNASYQTWKVLLSYLYTGEAKIRAQSCAIKLAKLDSSTAKLGDKMWNLNRCSPRSLYHLADALRLDDLKKSCIDCIIIGKENICKEIFSQFTSMYPSIQETQTDYLCKHLKEVEDFEISLKFAMTNTTWAYSVVAMIIRKLHSESEKEEVYAVKEKEEHAPSTELECPPVFNPIDCRFAEKENKVYVCVEEKEVYFEKYPEELYLAEEKEPVKKEKGYKKLCELEKEELYAEEKKEPVKKKKGSKRMYNSE